LRVAFPVIKAPYPGIWVRRCYDGESAPKGYGNRVKSVESGLTTLFVGGHYEVTGSQITKYYFAGSQRIAIRKYAIPQSMKVEYLLTDHPSLCSGQAWVPPVSPPTRAG